MSVRQNDRKKAYSDAGRARKLLNTLAVIVILSASCYIIVDYVALPRSIDTLAAAQPAEPAIVDPIPTQVLDISAMYEPAILFDEMLADVEALVKPIPNSMIASLKAESAGEDEVAVPNPS